MCWESLENVVAVSVARWRLVCGETLVEKLHVPRGLSLVSHVKSRRGLCGNEKTWIWLRSTTTSLQQHSTARIYYSAIRYNRWFALENWQASCQFNL